MTLIQPVNAYQIQGKIDEFAQHFLDLMEEAEELGIFNDQEMIEANVTNGMITSGSTGEPANITLLLELKNRLGVIAGFHAWAATPIAELNNKSPERYFRGVKRVI